MCVFAVIAVTVNGSFTAVAESWHEQRRYTHIAIDALGNHPVTAVIEEELGRISAQWPDLDGE